MKWEAGEDGGKAELEDGGEKNQSAEKTEGGDRGLRQEGDIGVSTRPGKAKIRYFHNSLVIHQTVASSLWMERWKQSLLPVPPPCTIWNLILPPPT